MFDAKMTELAAVIQKEMNARSVDVGILEDGPEKFPKEGTAKTGGFLHQRVGQDNPSVKISDVFRAFDGIYNILMGPFHRSENREVSQVIVDLIKDVNKSTDASKRRFLNAIQAVVRNPIFRGDYGDNSPETEKKKGFNKLMIATGTMFNAIKARFAGKR